jgi:hypothetical protein
MVTLQERILFLDGSVGAQCIAPISGRDTRPFVIYVKNDLSKSENTNEEFFPEFVIPNS